MLLCVLSMCMKLRSFSFPFSFPCSMGRPKLYRSRNHAHPSDAPFWVIDLPKRGVCSQPFPSLKPILCGSCPFSYRGRGGVSFFNHKGIEGGAQSRNDPFGNTERGETFLNKGTTSSTVSKYLGGGFATPTDDRDWEAKNRNPLFP